METKDPREQGRGLRGQKLRPHADSFMTGAGTALCSALIEKLIKEFARGLIKGVE